MIKSSLIRIYTMAVISFVVIVPNLHAAEPKVKGKLFDEIVSKTNSRGWYSEIKYFSGNEWSLNVSNDGSFATTTHKIGGTWPRGSANAGHPRGDLGSRGRAPCTACTELPQARIHLASSPRLLGYLPEALRPARAQ